MIGKNISISLLLMALATLVNLGECFVAFVPARQSTALKASSANDTDPAQIVGRRIKVKGDVNGGYVRTCIQNEASRFRKLIGTMSPPEDSNEAEIYVEGKRKNVEGFIRWCSKGSQKIGLSQVLEVVEVTEENPTGLYDDFYLKTHTEESSGPN